jgi:L-alanine-DL-glutamate epimerase-like enolase superfamily enzyme
VFPALKAIRGHNMAKAAVEMAAWDLFAKQRGEPLSRVLARRLAADAIAPSGVSIGIQRSLDELAAKVERELAPATAHQDQDQARGGISRRSRRCAPASARSR